MITRYSSILFLKTQLVQMIVFPWGHHTSIQTLCCSNSFSSSWISLMQSTSFNASATFLGSIIDIKLTNMHKLLVALLWLRNHELTFPMIWDSGWSWWNLVYASLLLIGSSSKRGYSSFGVSPGFRSLVLWDSNLAISSVGSSVP